MKCLIVIDGNVNYLKWHVRHSVSRPEWNPSRHFKKAETPKLTCNWERFAKQNSEAWQSGLFGLSHTTCFLFLICVVCVCVCWAIAKIRAVWAPAGCIDPANKLHHTSFQVLAERIIIALMLYPCVVYLTAVLLHGHSVQPAIELLWHAMHGSSRAVVWIKRLFKLTECVPTSWSLVYRFWYVWTGLLDFLGSLSLSPHDPLALDPMGENVHLCVCVCVFV